ncbi:unnamed protein product [Rhizopus stolonifer]
MSRKSERAAKKAAKKVEEVVVEKEEEESPEAVPVESEVESEENDEVIEEETSEVEEEEESQQVQRTPRAKINDETAMIRITEQFKLKDLPWIQTMTITSSEPVVVEDSTDDMARELAFYQQALEAAKLGRELVKKANVEFSRPDNYFAEMVKSDEHMAKVIRLE